MRHFLLFVALATLAFGQALTPIKNLTVTSDPTTPRYQLLKWEYDGSTDVSGFIVERSQDGSDWAVISIVGIDKPKALLDKTTVFGDHYWYRVTTLKMSFAKKSDPSPPVQKDAK